MELTPGQKRAKLLKKRDPNYFSKIGRKGNAARKQPYYHFRELKKKDPEAFMRLSQKQST